MWVEGETRGERLAAAILFLMLPVLVFSSFSLLFPPPLFFILFIIIIIALFFFLPLPTSTGDTRQRALLKVREAESARALKLEGFRSVQQVYSDPQLWIVPNFCSDEEIEALLRTVDSGDCWERQSRRREWGRGRGGLVGGAAGWLSRRCNVDTRTHSPL